METINFNTPDELFDNSSEQENHPELGNQSQTGAATDLDDVYKDTTDDEDGELEEKTRRLTDKEDE